MITRKKPYIEQKRTELAYIERLTKELEECILSIDDGDIEGARNDLNLILDELKGEDE